jgi:tetratricopeptide (TPR) repeat protein
MERSYNKRITIILCFILPWMFLLNHAKANDSGNASFQNLIYQSYVDGEMSLWESTLSSMEFEYKRNPSDGLLYDILLAQYGLTGYYLGNDDNASGGQLMERAAPYLEMMEDKSRYTAEAKLFKAAFYAFRIGMRPWLAVRLGPQSERLINDAIEIKPQYPRGWTEKGNMMYYAPAVFGGSKTKAIEHYKHAIKLMEADMQNHHRWLYLSTLVSLAQAYEETGNSVLAIITLEKSLEFEPDFKWVKDELLPELKSK